LWVLGDLGAEPTEIIGDVSGDKAILSLSSRDGQPLTLISLLAFTAKEEFVGWIARYDDGNVLPL
jgi:hypothetical protein